MAIEAAFIDVLAAALAGLVLSLAIERLMTPRPAMARPWAAWALQAGSLLLAHAALTLMLGRPWFAAAAVSAFLLMLVVVNNAKFKALREPFVFQDYEYFIDAIRHPRLYIPFLGWRKFLVAVAGGVLAVAVGLWIEEAPPIRLAWSGQLGGIAVVFAVGTLLLLVGNLKKLPVSFEPQRDVIALGFLSSLWRYAQEERTPLAVGSFFGHLEKPSRADGVQRAPHRILETYQVDRRGVIEEATPQSTCAVSFSRCPFDSPFSTRPEGELPHLVAVQSESFFDPRPLFDGIRPDVLAEFDCLRGAALAYGKLKVPAWGANTVRTEFAFLTGIGQNKLGVHRFNPYRAIAAGGDVPSLASYLKRLGYRTVCIHPYQASFYQRERVYPRLGFDEFIDIRTFDDTMRFGPYIGDIALANKVAEVLREATGPVFVFVITMENHGPLHLERVAPSDVDALYLTPPPDGCDDLTIYLRHLRNADQMIAKLRQTLERCERPASLCWFGDHVPIMPSVYETFGFPNGESEYFLWCTSSSACPCALDLEAHELPMMWLQSVGFESAVPREVL